MNGLLMERLQFVKGIDPAADPFDGTVYTDVVNVKNLSKVLFVIFCGVGATGTSTITVQACDDVVPTNRTAIPFQSRSITTGDTEGAITARAAAGFDTPAGSSKIVLIEIDESALASTGYGYVQLKAVEVVNSPVISGVVIIGEAKAASATKATAIV